MALFSVKRNTRTNSYVVKLDDTSNLFKNVTVNGVMFNSGTDQVQIPYGHYARGHNPGNVWHAQLRNGTHKEWCFTHFMICDFFKSWDLCHLHDSQPDAKNHIASHQVSSRRITPCKNISLLFYHLWKADINTFGQNWEELHLLWNVFLKITVFAAVEELQKFETCANIFVQ